MFFIHDTYNLVLFFFFHVISLNNDETSVREKDRSDHMVDHIQTEDDSWHQLLTESLLSFFKDGEVKGIWKGYYLEVTAFFFLAQNTWWSKFSLNRRVEFTLQVAYFSYQDVYRRNLAGLVYLYLSPSFYRTWIQQTLCSPYMSYTALLSKCAACSFVYVYC